MLFPLRSWRPHSMTPNSIALEYNVTCPLAVISLTPHSMAPISMTPHSMAPKPIFIHVMQDESMFAETMAMEAVSEAVSPESSFLKEVPSERMLSEMSSESPSSKAKSQGTESSGMKLFPESSQTPSLDLLPPDSMLIKVLIRTSKHPALSKTLPTNFHTANLIVSKAIFTNCCPLPPPTKPTAPTAKSTKLTTTRFNVISSKSEFISSKAISRQKMDTNQVKFNALAKPFIPSKRAGRGSGSGTTNQRDWNDQRKHPANSSSYHWKRNAPPHTNMKSRMSTNMDIGKRQISFHSRANISRRKRSTTGDIGCAIVPIANTKFIRLPNSTFIGPKAINTLPRGINLNIMRKKNSNFMGKRKFNGNGMNTNYMTERMNSNFRRKANYMLKGMQSNYKGTTNLTMTKGSNFHFISSNRMNPDIRAARTMTSKAILAKVIAASRKSAQKSTTKISKEVVPRKVVPKTLMPPSALRDDSILFPFKLLPSPAEALPLETSTRFP